MKKVFSAKWYDGWAVPFSTLWFWQDGDGTPMLLTQDEWEEVCEREREREARSRLRLWQRRERRRARCRSIWQSACRSIPAIHAAMGLRLSGRMPGS
jgi:hypothetical protein